MQNLSTFATALCLASVAAGIQLQAWNQTTAQSLAQQEDDFFAKAGTDCMACTSDQLDVVQELNNFNFQYTITNGNLDADYANENNVELVPMLSQSTVELSDGSLCCMRDPPTDVHNGVPVSTLCTAEMIADTLANTQSSLTTPMQYLMGPNESYVVPKQGKNPKKNQKYIATDDLVDMWRNIIQPAAVEQGLKLVTATTGAHGQKVSYLTAFLAGCWNLRNDETAPCDITLIEAFSVHDYKCAESYWQDNYAVNTGIFQTTAVSQMISQVGDSDEINWSDYINNMPIWVQETSCAGDPTPPDSAQQMCERISGQAGEDQGQDFGTGSIRWMVENDNIERWAWYSTYNTKSGNEDNRLINADGELLPPGRAIMNQGSSTTDCAAEPQV